MWFLETGNDPLGRVLLTDPVRQKERVTGQLQPGKIDLVDGTFEPLILIGLRGN